MPKRTFKGKKILVKNSTFKIPGKKISIILDTAPIPNINNLIKDSDLLITESTWSSEFKDEVQKLLRQVGYKADEAVFIPISGYKGDNVFNKSTICSLF